MKDSTEPLQDKQCSLGVSDSGSRQMVFLFEDFELDASRRELCRGGTPIAVEPKALDLLIYLLENNTRVVSKDDLYTSIWKDRIVSESTLAGCINTARKALEDSGASQRLIRTISRKGFRFVGEVRAAATRSGTGATALAIPVDRPSIAVLPFQNMSGDAAQDYLADGMVESITAGLSRIRDFFVIARNSAFVYKQRSVLVQEIGRELGVAYLLEGSVQSSNDAAIRVTVQLIETAHGTHLWAAQYDGKLSDLFGLQDQITAQVAGALQPSIRQSEIVRSLRKPPQELRAYDFTLQAMGHAWHLEADRTEQALALLGKALELDADYPLALALSAWCWAQRSVYNWVQDVAEARSVALQLADRAAGQATDEPLVLAVLGTVQTLGRHFGVARVMLQRAVAIDPNAAWALSRLGWLDVYTDRPEQARRSFEAAIRLSPLDPMNFNNYVGLASARQVAGDDAAAADLFLRALQERPKAIWIHRNLAPALYGAGRLTEARASLAAQLAAYPRFTIGQFKDAMAFSPGVLDRIGLQLRALGVRD